MGIGTAIAAVSAIVGAHGQHKARKSAERSARKDRDAAALAAEGVDSPTELPDPYSTAAIEGKKRKMAQLMGRQMTRSSTVLTDRLGG